MTAWSTKSATFPITMFPNKSLSDYRNYKIINLENGIKVLLVSDIRPKTLRQDIASVSNDEEEENTLAAAALCVNAGSFHEPSDVPGLAHFLEHMVFMGSEKYPEENGYDSFLNMHGGSNNAYTEDESTVFYFDVQPKYFEGALDRFAQFFILPLLREDAVDREVKAVDSEFKGLLTDDNVRGEAVLRKLASVRHPYSRFTYGNKKSIVTIPKEKGINVMERLRAFFQNQYCNRQMTLSLCSSVPLDELESLAKKYFSEIPTRDHVKILDFEKIVNPFDLEQFHKLIYVYPVEEVHLLDMSWVMRPFHKHYRTKAGFYVSWLLNDRCQGSIYAALKDKGYISSITACHLPTKASSFAFFYISIELAEKGLDNIDQVVHTVFQYLTMLSKNGASEEIYKQIQEISDQCFKYEEPSEPCDLVETIVDNMQYYEEEDILSGSSLLREYNSDLIEEIQNVLSIDKVNITVQSKKFHNQCKDVERWFKAKYSVQDIPEKWIDETQCTAENLKLHLPKQNPYIPKDFNIYNSNNSKTTEYPTVIEDTVKGKIWFKPDFKFLLPKSDMNFMLVTPVPQKSQYHLLASSMLERVLAFELEELVHEAGVASLSIEQNGAINCHTISLCGFSDKLYELLQNFMKLLSSFQFSEIGFDISKEELERDLRNALIRSEELNGKLKNMILCNIVGHPIECLKELVDFTPESLKDYFLEYFSQFYVESLFQGNVSQEQAEKFQSCIYDSFKNTDLPRDDFPVFRTLQLPLGRTLCRHLGLSKSDPNSVVHNYYEVGPATLRMMTTATILARVMEEPLFDMLRTKQQLGYSVYCNVEYSEGGILAYSITVETDSTKFTADEIDTKITDFVKEFYKKLEEDEGYDAYVSSYIKSLQQADLCVADEVSRNWSEIFFGDYIFDRRQRKIELAKKIAKSEVLEFLHKYMLAEEHVKMLSIQVIGHSDDEEEEEEDSSSEDESDSEDDYSSSDEEHAEEMESLRHREIKLLDVSSSQYTRTMKDIDTFRTGNGYHPSKRLTLK